MADGDGLGPLKQQVSAADLTPAEQAANERLVRLQSRVIALKGRMQAQPREPKPLSSLWSDDQAARHYQISHAAWGAIMHAGDNVIAAYDMTVTQTAETHYDILTRPYAVYPMLRAAYENACRSLWLTSAPTRPERLRRRFRMAIADASMQDEVAAKSNQGTADYRKNVVEDIKPHAARAGISMNSLKTNLAYTEIVRDAAHAMTVTPDMSEVVWRSLSGLTHGDLWATLVWLDQEQVGVSKDGTSVTLRTTSPSNKVALFFEICLHTTEIAIEVYDDRCEKRFQP